MSKKTKILIAVLIVLAISGNIAIIKHRVDEKNRKIEEEQERIEYTGYLHSLGLYEDELIYSGEMNKKVEFDENILMMRVAYFNGVMGYTQEEAITTDDVKKYYQEYLDGDKTNIEFFSNIVSGNRGNNTPNKNYEGVSVDEFELRINKSLDDDITSTTATPEQMEEAIKKTMSDYETGKYRDAVDSPLEQDDMKKEFQELIDPSPELQEFIDSSPKLDNNH